MLNFKLVSITFDIVSYAKMLLYIEKADKRHYYRY